jgi:hypothetical protein
MGAAAPLIAKVETPSYGHVVIDASDGKRYHADLSPLAAVYCYPKTDDAWNRVCIDAYGLALVWTSRFEVHVDQIVGLADRVESGRRSA